LEETIKRFRNRGTTNEGWRTKKSKTKNETKKNPTGQKKVPQDRRVIKECG